MIEIKVQSVEQTFNLDDYTVELRFNKFNNYWFYNIYNEDKSKEMYGIPLYINNYPTKELEFLEIPQLILIDSEPNNILPIDLLNDIGARLKLIQL